MVNATALKKGAPPKRGQGVDPIKNNNRPEPATEKGKPYQFVIPPSVYEEMMFEAMKVHGSKKGSKSEFILTLWENYKKNNKLQS